MGPLKLGRIEQFDTRSRNFSVSSIFGTPAVSKNWDSFGSLNQGNMSACVGFSWCHQLLAEPNPVSHVEYNTAVGVYKLAQTLDDTPGESYEGTSILAGVKAIQALFPEVATSYHWAFSVEELAQAISFIGPVVMGINWYSGMYTLDNGGYIHPTGARVGGHAILAKGVDMEAKHFIMKNSWGNTWGLHGECYIHFSDMERLMRERGEACVPTGKLNYCPA